MSLIGRAWKANVNVWKRHLTLQSIFNCGECMMQVDKNVNGHVVDQNVDRISREIAYVPLGGGIRSKRSSCMQFFFFFWMSTRHAYLWSRQNEDLEFWTCFLEVRWIWIFGRTSQRSVDLKFWCAYQRSDGFVEGDICANVYGSFTLVPVK